MYGPNFLYSALISNAQRLPNGNTLICEGLQNRILEVTPAQKIVWEYINPYVTKTYRAYRVPYEWVPQLAKGKEVSVTRPDHRLIVVPNDNGEIPNIYPAKDVKLAPDFTRVMPVLTPALDKSKGNIQVVQGNGKVEEFEELPADETMKSY